MTGLLSLAQKLEGRLRALDSEANALAVKVAETILADLVYVTPVDVSTALSNWQVSLDKPAPAPIDAFFPGEHGTTQAQSAAEALAVGRRILQQKRPGQTVYISNVLRYIQYLNEGTSQQEPGGFVERAVLLGRKTIEKARRK